MRMRLLILLLGLVLPAWGDTWLEHRNTETSEQKRAGWSMELPSNWEKMPEVVPGPPLGEGYREPNGKAWIIITWLNQKSDKADEMNLLPKRGYTERNIRVAGHDANEYIKRRPDGGSDKVIYVFSLEGGARIYLVSTTPNFDDVFQRAVMSFNLLSVPRTDVAWKSYLDKVNGYTLLYPPEWTVTAPEGSLEMTLGPAGSAPAVLFRVIDRPADQSFRGFARSHGASEVPGAKLDGFDPITTTSGLNGYIARWGRVSLAYLPLGKWALMAKLMDPRKADQFKKLLLTVAHQGS